MILIFGGAYQGKLDYALERFKASREDVYGCNDEDIAMPENKKIVYEIDKWLLALLKSDIDTDEAVGRFIAANPDAIIICNDISCGVVPLDLLIRRWREAVGRAMALFSRNSDEVIRLFCGIPMRVK